MRHKKRKKAARQAMSMTIVVVVVLAMLIVLACSRVFIVRNVMVVGNRNLLSEEVITQSGVQLGDNLLSISSAQLRERLEQNRYIEYIGHDFDYRGTLTLRISERLGMAVVYDLGYYYVLDAHGMVLECAGSGYGVALDARNLDESAYRVACEAQMVFQTHFCCIFDLRRASSHELRYSCCRHRTCDSDFSLTSNFSS